MILNLMNTKIQVLKTIQSQDEDGTVSLTTVVFKSLWCDVTRSTLKEYRENSGLEEDKENNTLTIMLDGGDWAGIWAQRMHTEGLVKLGFTEFPIRFFAPVILDWSGAKFSKSLYLKNDAYKDINSAFINYDNFIEYYGEKGMKKLWNEVKNWIEDPKKFFRNYSVDYFQMIMGENNNE